MMLALAGPIRRPTVRAGVATLMMLAVPAPPASAQDIPINLPWRAGDAHTVYQANDGGYSHKPGTNLYYAWDFAMPRGTGVLAVANGTVHDVGRGCGEGGPGNDCHGGWGNFVRVCHDDGTTCSRYAHLRDVLVNKGDRVGRTSPIGRSGRSGDLTGEAHLHFQMERPPSSNSIPYSFLEAGVPQYGDSPVSRNGDVPTFQGLDFGTKDNTGGVLVTAGDTVRVRVAAVYAGPWAIPCGHAAMGVHQPQDTPMRWATHFEGWTYFRDNTFTRALPTGCHGALDPGEGVAWRLAFKVPDDTAEGMHTVGVLAGVHERVAWGRPDVEVKLHVVKRTVDPPPPEPPLTLTARVMPGQRLQTIARSGLTVEVRCSRSCFTTVGLKIGPRMARRLRLGRVRFLAFARAPLGDSARMVLPPTSRKARRALRRARRIRATLLVTATDDGEFLQRRIPVLLRR